MELRRMGLAKKLAYVVPNNVFEQWRQEFYRAYPNATILAPDEMDAASRNTMIAKFATNDYDALLLPESQFTMIPVRPETRRAHIVEEMRTLSEYQVQAVADEQRAGDTSRGR